MKHGNERDAGTAEAPRVEARVTICNRKGLHARASARFVQTVSTFDAELTVTRDGETVEGGSMLGLMSLAAGPGTELVLTATGPEAEAALTALANLVTRGFDEEPG